MKTTILFLVFFLMTFYIPATDIVPLPDIVKPATISLDDSQLYITEGIHIYIYSQKDYKLLKKFGKDGEGPQEFKILPQLPLAIYVHGDNLTVNSFGKISRFTKTGEFINEEKVKGGFVFLVQPLGENLVGQGVSFEDGTRYRSINIYDAQLTKLKEMVKVQDNFQPGKGITVLKNALTFYCYKNKLYLSTGNDFKINVYEEKGKNLYSFSQDIQREKVTETLKKDVDEYFKNDPRFKQFYEILKPIKFPSHLPALRDIRIKDNKMYVLTFKNDKENGLHQWFIFDLQGKLLKKVMLPMQYLNALEHYPYTIHKDKLYQVIENQDDEEWQLHITEIK